jgi:hypothetical protein
VDRHSAQIYLRSLIFAFARRNDVSGRIRFDNNSVVPVASDVDGEQTFNGGKAGQVAQKVTSFPGSAVSSVTSTHGVTRQGSRPKPTPIGDRAVNEG